MSAPKPITYSEDIRPHDTEKALDTVRVQLFPDEATLGRSTSAEPAPGAATPSRFVSGWWRPQHLSN